LTPHAVAAAQEVERIGTWPATGRGRRASVLVSLTPRGDELRAEAAAIPTTLATASGLSTKDLAALRTTLVGLTEALTNPR
jgi:hypothetical protein